MSHSYGNGNPNGNNYLNKKRYEDDVPMDTRYHYDKFSKFDKYGSHNRYNNMSMHSNGPPGNSYYNSNPRFRGNYYNGPKSLHGNNYSNKFAPKREYKKPFQKYPNPNSNEGIKNLSHCEMPSPSSLNQKPKQDGDSYKSIYASSTSETKISPNIENSRINQKELNKFVSNITSRLPPGPAQPIQNSTNNISIAINVTSSSGLKFKEQLNSDKKENSKKWEKEEEDKPEEEFPIVKFPKPSEKLQYFEQFNKNLIKIETNPLENFEFFPKSLYDLNCNGNFQKFPNCSSNFTNPSDTVDTILSLKSCYLLAKIPNWRLVTNFVPATALKEEKFKNIPIDKDEDMKIDKEGDKKKDTKDKKSYLVYSEKYEDTVEKYLEQNMAKRKQLKNDIFNVKYIISQYRFDILKIKNNIKQNIYKIKYLTIKQDITRNAIEEQNKEH